MHDPNSKYILEKLGEININTEYRVDDAFISLRETKVNQYRDNNGKSRSIDERRLDIDCEFVDEMVKRAGKDYILEASHKLKHDFRFRKDPEGVVWCVDNKVIHEDIFWLHINKYVQYLESYNQGKLHYFAFWKFIDRPTKPLKVGDKPEFLLLSVIPAGTLLHKMCDPKMMTKNKDKYKVCVV
jgi:hypothetical protein